MVQSPETQTTPAKATLLKTEQNEDNIFGTKPTPKMEMVPIETQTDFHKADGLEIETQTEQLLAETATQMEQSAPKVFVDRSVIMSPVASQSSVQ